MDLEVTIDTMRRIAAARGATGLDRTTLVAGLRDVTVLRSWLSAAEADLTRQLSQAVPFPEATLVDTSSNTARQESDDEGEGNRADTPDAHWNVTWPIPVEIPARILHELMDEPGAHVHAVIVRNGVVLYAPGELNLGRTTRLANRAHDHRSTPPQRRLTGGNPPSTPSSSGELDDRRLLSA